MRPTLTRREFLLDLIPSWLTKRNLQAAGVGIAVFLAAKWALALGLELGVIGMLKLLGISAAAMGLFWCGINLIEVLKELGRRLPPVVTAVLVVLGRWLGFALSAAVGIHIYARWQRGDDMTGLGISFAIFFVCHVRSEWEERRKRLVSSESQNAPPATALPQA